VETRRNCASRLVLESREPHCLITLAEAGQAIAIVPSTIRFAANRVRIIPLLREGQSLGAWGGVAWDPRRSLPTYAATFVEEFTTYAMRNVPGKRFDRVAPPLVAHQSIERV
jgi:LysR family transcriptional regulator, nitrogen assimilation regulatory protein